MRHIRATAVAALTFWSAAATAIADIYPTVLVTPGPDKSLDIFHQDQAECRDYADHFVRGEVSPAHGMLGGAAVGAALGAITGSAVGGRHSHGAAVGAVGGALAGTALGAHAAQQAMARVQRAYDDAYVRCMYAHQDIVPGEDPAEAAKPPPPPEAIRPGG